MSEEASITAREDDGTVWRDLEFRDIREAEREVDFVCSTEDIDSYGTILKSNWDLTRYLKNPVVLFAHDQRSLPIGTAKNVRVVKKQLLATVKFMTAKANPRAEECFQSVLEGSLRGISVGFYPREVYSEKQKDKDIYVLDDNELRELSLAPVPSNPNALAQLRMRAAAHQQTRAHVAPNVASVPQENSNMGAQNEASSELEKKFSALEADKRAAEKRIEELTRDSAALERQIAALVTERDALKSERDQLRSEGVERHVDSFLGVKFDRAERAEMLELAQTNLGLFDRMMKQRGDIPMATKKVVMGDEGAAEKRSHASANPLREAHKKGAA